MLNRVVSFIQTNSDIMFMWWNAYFVLARVCYIVIKQSQGRCNFISNSSMAKFNVSFDQVMFSVVYSKPLVTLQVTTKSVLKRLKLVNHRRNSLNFKQKLKLLNEHCNLNLIYAMNFNVFGLVWFQVPFNFVNRNV